MYSDSTLVAILKYSCIIFMRRRSMPNVKFLSGLSEMEYSNYEPISVSPCKNEDYNRD